jgi:SAM-dependent methyltransferase
MPRRNKPAVQKYHDRVARRYDASYEDEFWHWHDALTWDYLKAHLPRDLAHPVLDLGCGTGKWGLKLLQSGYRVAFVDISGAMVEKARDKVGQTSGSERATFHQADLCDLSALPEATYAFAVGMGDPVSCATNPPKAMKEIRKRLRPGGILVATLDNKLAALDFYLDAGDAAGMEAFLRSGRTHWLTADAAEQFELHTFTPQQGRKLFDQAGFDVLELRGKTVLNMRSRQHLLADPEPRRAWLNLEKTLSKDPDAAARASHLQIVGRVQNP